MNVFRDEKQRNEAPQKDVGCRLFETKSVIINLQLNKTTIYINVIWKIPELRNLSDEIVEVGNKILT